MRIYKIIWRSVRNLFLVLLNIKGKQKHLPAVPVERPVLLPITNIQGKFAFFCPGCDGYHLFYTVKIGDNSVHSLKGTMAAPTIYPSVLIKEEKRNGIPRCHSFVTNGFIEYLSDCTHELVGQTIKLPPVDSDVL